ncbi:hypothetical protein BLS_001351 [Venturia inaequalis]|uniref:Peptidase A1 domain-containing protein n=1 Tax=Venturia inaequalis TaxID=5025 RepID=A0A8H3VBR1_VENIN|nr:hypothetical protein EG328_002190 [Venturia inaequalis]KAE9979027.1 hypothetical protein EG327_007188 [Venturia inaequalis]KAE9984778.1 hypothetical protein BLS_001351 [Venturia inaequalis]RDI83085.1 hypothetical protein Vi05172_g6993 [Venturia inaequalis]
MSLPFLLICSVLLGGAVSNPLEKLAKRGHFSLEQVAVPRKQAWFAPRAMQRTYLKYGLPIPNHLHEALNATSNGTGQATVPVRPVKGDVEYLINVTVGNHVLALDMDTGSSDLWVFSTLQPEDQRTNRPIARVYDTKGVSAKKLEGHTWQIRYGDMSGANGQVYLDRVGIGNVFFDQQAVEAASSVSRTFSKDAANDGLLGLAFSKLNTIKPKAQPTWFDNIRGQLAEPVFTAALKRRAIGSYDFGYIDKAKYTGEIVYTTVTGNRGFWTFGPTGYSVGDGPVVPATINAIADTGTSLWYLPRAVADGYWAKVPGAQYSSLQAGWMFPCGATLPDISMVIAGTKVVVPGINMDYQKISSQQCYGGIQRDTGMPFSIFGDVFLKGVFVVFEAAEGKTPRLGFAQQS